MAALAKSRATVIFAGAWLTLGIASAAYAQTLRITSPSDGAVVNPGQTLSVTVSADPAAVQGVAIFGQSPLGSSALQTSAPYKFLIDVPADITTGRYGLTALAIPKSGGQPLLSLISIYIERPDAPQQIRSQDSRIDFRHAGDEDYLLITGVFADGSELILTNSSLISFSSDTPSVATVVPNGRVTAMAPGDANLIVTYGSAVIGQSTIRIPVTVPPPLEVIPAVVSLSASESVSFVSLAHMPGDVALSVEWSIRPQVGRVDAEGTYTAPASVVSRQGVTVTATSVADPTISATAQIWLLPSAPAGTSPR